MFSSIRTLGRRSLPLVVALATLATAACGGGDDSPAGPGPSTAEATVTVVNHAPNSVLFLRYRTCGSSGWSSDVLGASVLSTGEQHSWDLAPGCYDIRASPAATGLDYLYFNGVQLSAGEAKTLEITAFPAE